MNEESPLTLGGTRQGALPSSPFPGFNSSVHLLRGGCVPGLLEQRHFSFGEDLVYISSFSVKALVNPPSHPRRNQTEGYKAKNRPLKKY